MFLGVVFLWVIPRLYNWCTALGSISRNGRISAEGSIVSCMHQHSTLGVKTHWVQGFGVFERPLNRS